MAWMCEAEVTGSGVNFRAEAGLNGTSLGLMYPGEKLKTFQIEKTVDEIVWENAIRVQTGQSGWVAKQYIRVIQCHKIPD